MTAPNPQETLQTDESSEPTMQASIEGEKQIESRISFPVALKEANRSRKLDFDLEGHLSPQGTSRARADGRGEERRAPKRGRHHRKRTTRGVEEAGVDAAIGRRPSLK